MLVPIVLLDIVLLKTYRTFNTNTISGCAVSLFWSVNFGEASLEKITNFVFMTCLKETITTRVE